jgi:hypothetical protein
MTTIDPGRLTESRYAMLLGEAGVARLVERAGPFFARPRDPEALARLFAIFRVGEHHAVITIGRWLGTTSRLDVQEGFARLVWDEARHTHVWTERMKELIGERAVERHYPDPRRVEQAWRSQ